MLGGILTEDIKIAIVRKPAPEGLRRHLQLTANFYQGHCEVLHDAVESYWKAKFEENEELEEFKAMEMDDVKVKGKGKGKGKEKNKNHGQQGL